MLIRINDHFKLPNNLKMPQKAIVASNKDPRGIGRVKAYVQGVLEGDIDALPWIMPWKPGSGGTAGSSNITPPSVGSIIAVEFKFNDIYSGFYTGYWVSEKTKSGVFNEQYPETDGKTDEAGNSWIVNKSTGEATFRHQSGSALLFDKEGNVTIRAKNKINFEGSDTDTVVTHDMRNGSSSSSGDSTVNNLSGKETNITSSQVTLDTGNVTTKASTMTSQITGGVEESIGGSKSTSVLGNKAEIVSGASDNLYALGVTETFGLGKTENYVAGSILKNILLGSETINLVAGSHTYTIQAGSYTVSVTTGSISFLTAAGVFTCGTAAGSITVDAAGNIIVLGTTKTETISGAYTLTSGGAITLSSAGVITIQSAGFSGGAVLTNVTEPLTDSITGKPSLGVLTTLA